jgi:hypothetical protein
VFTDRYQATHGSSPDRCIAKVLHIATYKVNLRVVEGSVVGYFKMLFRYLTGRIEENLEKFVPVLDIPPRHKSDIPAVQFVRAAA